MNDLNDCSYHIEHQQSWNHMKNCGTTNTVLVNMQLCSRFSCNKKHFIKNSFDQEFVTSCHKSVNIFFLFWIQKERNIDSLWSESADRVVTAAVLCFAPRFFWGKKCWLKTKMYPLLTMYFVYKLSHLKFTWLWKKELLYKFVSWPVDTGQSSGAEHSK